MESNTPVIGKIPNLVPEWMETIDEEGNPMIKNNGVWTNTTVNIPELIATYLKIWLEDAIPSELLENVKESQGKYTMAKQKEALTSVYATLVNNRLNELNLAKSRLEEANLKLSNS